MDPHTSMLLSVCSGWDSPACSHESHLAQSRHFSSILQHKGSSASVPATRFQFPLSSTRQVRAPRNTRKTQINITHTPRSKK